MERIGNVFRKRGDTEILRQEFEKTVAAAAIAHKTGLFRVPKVLDFDAKDGQMDTEWIPGLCTLQALALKDAGACYGLCGRLGSAIAMVHENLTLRTREPIAVHSCLDGLPGNQVFCHGDLTCRNVCYDTDHKSLVILDWATAPLLSGRGTRATRYFDLIWFSFDLFFLPTAAKMAFWKASPMADAFLSGYSAQCRQFAPNHFNLTAAEMAPCLRKLLNHPPPPRLRSPRAIARALKERIFQWRWQNYLLRRRNGAASSARFPGGSPGKHGSAGE